MPNFHDITRRTSRLLLRPMRPGDAAALLEIHGDAQVARYLSRPRWTSIDEARARIARDIAEIESGGSLRLGIERAEDGRLIGECTLFSFHEASRRAEIGYSMATHAWGHGYMHEALSALLDLGFGALSLNRVEADIDPRNTASARSLERLGFTKEGHLRERWIVAGEVSDSWLYGLLASDWRKTPSPARGSGLE
jgi:ribosomal-protein-alanine N-acetyltransferase